MDPQRSAILRLLQQEAGPLIMPAPVTAEVDYLLGQRGGAAAARAFLVDLVSGRFQVESLTREEHGLALALHDRYADLHLGLADLAVIVLAARYHCTRIVAFDVRHFRAVMPLQGGSFTLLPADGG